MSNKFNYDGYALIVDFKTDFILSITASYNTTGEHFMNDSVELTKIKKDTVMAALSRKGENNLRCNLWLI